MPYFQLKLAGVFVSEELVQVPSSVTECEKLFMQFWKESVPEKKKSQELLLQFIDQARERNRHPFETSVMLLGECFIKLKYGTILKNVLL